MNLKYVLIVGDFNLHDPTFSLNTRHKYSKKDGKEMSFLSKCLSKFHLKILNDANIPTYDHRINLPLPKNQRKTTNLIQ